MSNTVFILYDGRAKSGDTDRAIAMDTADSEEEAVEASFSHEEIDAVWYEYDLVDGVAVNERPRFDIGKGVLL